MHSHTHVQNYGGSDDDDEGMNFSELLNVWADHKLAFLGGTLDSKLEVVTEILGSWMFRGTKVWKLDKR